MDTILIYIIVFSFIGSVLSLIGGVILLTKEKFALKISHLLSAFAGGALLGTAFFDLLPEGLEQAQELGLEVNVFLWSLLGVLVFFLLERFIHHHDQNGNPAHKQTLVPLIVIGDSIHNFIDGVAMAATFLISIPLGIVTALAVAAHEIPQEIGDFGLMLHKGVARKKVLLINFYSALAALLGAILTYLAKDKIENLLPAVLGLTAGFFIYIAAANLIPEIHHQGNQRAAFWETMALILGVIVVYMTITILEVQIIH
ncbi:MAG: ZIP family metal transporter [Candidatus Daviesbacteria bacterium]|nr:MAG: ZIP family metal transporter [Candidatus Daviesbacteria bacterium]